MSFKSLFSNKIKLLFIGFSILTGTIGFASAHQQQVITIDGKDYLFVIGSLNEPVVVGDKTGIDLRVFVPDPKDIGNASATGSKPVIGLEKTLKIENISGSSRKEFPLSAAWGKPGSYQTVFYPTSSNKFSYRIFGTIDGKDVDVQFSCNEAGHVMGDMKGGMIQMKNGTTDVKFDAGSFGCPKEKKDFTFPTTSRRGHIGGGVIAIVLIVGLAILLFRNKKGKTEAISSFTGKDIALGVGTLVFGLILGYMLRGSSQSMPTMTHGSMSMDSMMMDMTESLKGKSGDAFDKVFLEEMVVHHQGAVDMAEMALQSAKHKEIKDLSQAIITAQNKEIAEMKAWYKTWYGVDLR